MDPSMRSDHLERRSFVGRVAAAALAVVAGAGHAMALPAQPTERGTEGGSVPMPPDWIRALRGSHRTVFDVAAHRNGKPLEQAKNFLDAWHEAYGVPDGDICLVLGVHGDALPILIGDAIWHEFGIGELYQVVDAATGTAALRNVFAYANAASGGLVAPEQSVESLQRRNVRFIVCNNTLAGATRRLVAAGRGDAERIRSMLVGGLLGGVKVVPAMVVALTQLQEAGLAYTKLA